MDGKLTQQYIVDAWSKIEGERLKYIRTKQRRLRTEMYCGLMDHIRSRAEKDNIKPRKMVILPSSVVRVFQKRACELKKELRGKGIFGKPFAWIYVIEFQKRGLHHMHMLLFFKKEYIIRDLNQ